MILRVQPEKGYEGERTNVHFNLFSVEFKEFSVVCSDCDLKMAAAFTNWVKSIISSSEQPLLKNASTTLDPKGLLLSSGNRSKSLRL